MIAVVYFSFTLLCSLHHNPFDGDSRGRGAKLLCINYITFYWWKWNRATLCTFQNWCCATLPAGFTPFPSVCDSDLATLVSRHDFTGLLHVEIWWRVEHLKPNLALPEKKRYQQHCYNASYHAGCIIHEHGSSYLSPGGETPISPSSVNELSVHLPRYIPIKFCFHH